MATKPKRKWTDVQLAIMTLSMASVLGLWNLFAGPDRESAAKKVAEAQSAPPEPVEAPSVPESPPIRIVAAHSPNACIAPIISMTGRPRQECIQSGQRPVNMVNRAGVWQSGHVR